VYERLYRLEPWPVIALLFVCVLCGYGFTARQEALGAANRVLDGRRQVPVVERLHR
jgi:hypothetical protein